MERSKDKIDIYVGGEGFNHNCNFFCSRVFFTHGLKFNYELLLFCKYYDSIYTHAHVHCTYMYTCTCIHTYQCTCTNVHVMYTTSNCQLKTHTHTHTHTHTQGVLELHSEVASTYTKTTNLPPKSMPTKQ